VEDAADGMAFLVGFGRFLIYRKKRAGCSSLRVRLRSPAAQGSRGRRLPAIAGFAERRARSAKNREQGVLSCLRQRRRPLRGPLRVQYVDSVTA
jgi:hypothetical protein